MFGSFVPGALALAALTAALATGITPAGAAPTITNGNFEGFAGCVLCSNGSDYTHTTQQFDGTLSGGGLAGTYTNWSTNAGYAFILSPSQAINGFSGPAGSLALWSPGVGGNGGSGSNAIISSPAGGNFLAVDPSYPSTGSYIQTSLTGLITGGVYSVSYYTAAAQQTGFSLPNGVLLQTDSWQIKVLDGTTSALKQTINQSSFTAGNHEFSGWIQQTFSLTATAASMTLQFLASSSISAAQPPFVLLDGVTASTSVPEPSAMALLATGVLGLVGFTRRRKRA